MVATISKASSAASATRHPSSSPLWDMRHHRQRSRQKIVSLKSTGADTSSLRR